MSNRMTPGPRIDIDRMTRDALAGDRPFRDLFLNPPPVRATLWNIYVQPLPPPKETRGGIQVVKSVQDAEAILQIVGRVFDVGPAALDGKTEGGIDLSKFGEGINSGKDLVGRYVIMQRNAGDKVTAVDDEYVFYSVTCSAIIGVINGDPRGFRAYI